MKTREFKGYIYSLSDPRDKQVRYIGQTVDLGQRERGHRCDSRSQPQLKAWIRELKSLGLTPEMKSLGRFRLSILKEHEQKFIDTYKASGAVLFNRHKATAAPYVSQYSHRVECIETGEVFPSYSAAARHFGVCSKTISNRCEDGEFVEWKNRHHVRVLTHD